MPWGSTKLVLGFVFSQLTLAENSLGYLRSAFSGRIFRFGEFVVSSWLEWVGYTAILEYTFYTSPRDFCSSLTGSCFLLFFV